MFKRLSSLLFLAIAACTPVGSGNDAMSGPECATAQPQPTKAETSAWNRAKRANTADSYRSFLRQHPKSCYAARAAAMLSERLNAAKPKIAQIGRSPNKNAVGKAY